MAWSVDNGSVTMTKGRAHTVAFQVDFRTIEKWAKRMKADVPKLMTLSFARACKGLKDKLMSVMKNQGGVYGVPKFKDFEAFTQELRQKSGKTTPMGGVLALKDAVGAWGSGTVWKIGFKDYYAEAARKFQEGTGGHNSEKWFVDPDYRKLWHKQGFAEIPRAYVHNQRMIMPQPFGKYIEQNMDLWAKEAYFKGLAKLMAGQKDSAFQKALKKV